MRLPDRPPFALRARLLTPLADGGTADFPDGVVAVDANGVLAWVGSASEFAGRLPNDAQIDGVRTPDDRSPDEPIDLRPLVVLPGMVDLHAHLPQLPNAGLGAGLDLLTWLDRYIFPLERAYGERTAARTAPAAFRAFAAAGTTTVVAYAAIWPES